MTMKHFGLSVLFAGLIHGVGIAQTNAQAFSSDWNRGPLNVFDRENLFCGRGWEFPGLIWGDRPVSVCIVKTRRQNRFGGPFGF